MDGRSSESPVFGEVLDSSEGGQVESPPRRARARGPQSRAEAMAWALFSAGGFVAAVVLPINVAVIGVAFAAGWLPDRALAYGRVLHMVRNPITKLYLLVVIALPLYHWAHRFRFAIHHQFGIHAKRVVAAACYGTALAGTGLAVWALLRI